jgi:hypothetical protein
LFFKEEFIDSLRSDPIAGTIKMVDLVQKTTSHTPEWDDSQREILVEAYALVTEMLETGILPLR